MRIRLTLDINRHRTTPQQPQDEGEEMPNVWEASGTVTERAGPQRIGFAISAPGDHDTWEDRT